MGWFGRTFIAVVAVTLIGSVLFFFNIFNLDAMSFFSDSDDQATASDELSEETIEKVEEVRETVGEKNQDIGQLVSETHEFYNETTGMAAFLHSIGISRQKKPTQFYRYSTKR